jgi:hypothetical protein
MDMHHVMKAALCALFALALLPAAAVAQDPLAGDWDVTVSISGQTIPLVLHLATGESGLEGTFDSPAQGAMGLPILSIEHEHPKVRFELETGGAPAILDGTHEGDAISGDFSQGPATGTFTAKKTSKEAGAESETPGDGR